MAEAPETDAVVVRDGAPLVAAAEPLPQGRNPAAVYLASLPSPHSQRAMRAALESIAYYVSGGEVSAESLPWYELRYQHVQAIRSWLASGKAHSNGKDAISPATANLRLSALRGVLREAWRLGFMPAEDYHRAVDFKGIRGKRLPKGRALKPGELRAIFAACAEDPKPVGARDAAALALLFGAGLRRSEVAALDLADLDRETGELRIRGGKGNRDRIAYLANGSLEAVEAWIAERGTQPGPLLWPASRAGDVLPGRLSTQALRRLCRKRAKQAAIPEFAPHDLRRTFVSELLDAGVDLNVARALAGHANVTTTAGYDRRPEEAKRKGAQALSVPFQARRICEPTA